MKKSGLIVMAVVLLGVTSAHAQKAPTAEDLNRLMKRAGAAQLAIPKLLTDSKFADAKAQVATLQQVITQAQAFWSARKKDDAVQMGQGVLAKLDGFSKTLSASPVNTQGAMAASRDLATTCNGCHKVYRATNEDNEFILKPGTVEN